MFFVFYGTSQVTVHGGLIHDEYKIRGQILTLAAKSLQGHVSIFMVQAQKLSQKGLKVNQKITSF